jgi:predicted dehydrogenase
MSFTRRHFFYGTLLAGAVPAGGYGATPSLKTAGYKSPNEKLNIASIGAGGRAASDIEGCATENIVALCDVDQERSAATFKKYDKATKYTDFRQMLDKENANIDAVIVAIPDHMHATAALWAMQRGKHVYCEKPLTRYPWEARLLTDAAAKYKVATQMGNQGYSNEGTRIASEIIWSGEIGDVTEVHAWTNRPVWPQGIDKIPQEESIRPTLDWDLWLGPAPMRSYTSGGEAYARGQNKFYLPFNWRGHLDFGTGSMGDMACHILGAPNMALRPNPPISVEVIKTEGKNQFTYPTRSVTKFEFGPRGTMPAFTLFWYDGASGPMYRPSDVPESEPLISGLDAFGYRNADAQQGGPSANQLSSVEALIARGGDPSAVSSAISTSESNNGALFVGSKGYLTTDTYAAAVRLLPEARHKAYKLPPKFLTRSPGHHRDWIRAAKGLERSCSDFSIAGPMTEWMLLSTIAIRFEGKLLWDSEKMRITNNAAANELVKPKFRRGWELKL